MGTQSGGGGDPSGTGSAPWSCSPLQLSLLLLVSLTILLFSPLILSPKYPTPATTTDTALPSVSEINELDDLALFRRATLSSRSSGDLRAYRRGASPDPKIAFLFLTNSNLSFAPLWDIFFRGQSRLFNVYIHADPSSRVLAPGGSFPASRFISAKPTRRASPSLVAAARRLLAAALLDDPDNAFFALVSQHCVPIHSFRFVYKTIFSNGTVNSGNSSAAAAGASNSSISFIEVLTGEPGLWDRYVARGEDVMLPEVPFSSFRVGSQFFVLSRRHALLVVEDRQLWSKFRLPCLAGREFTCYPEEHYFPTLLSMRDPGGCARYTLTNVNWTGSSDGHPHNYEPMDVSVDLVNKLRSTSVPGRPRPASYLFARKFSPDCLGPLLQIAESVLFRD